MSSQPRHPHSCQARPRSQEALRVYWAFWRPPTGFGQNGIPESLETALQPPALAEFQCPRVASMCPDRTRIQGIG